MTGTLVNWLLMSDQIVGKVSSSFLLLWIHINLYCQQRCWQVNNLQPSNRRIFQAAILFLNSSSPLFGKHNLFWWSLMMQFCYLFEYLSLQFTEEVLHLQNSNPGFFTFFSFSLNNFLKSTKHLSTFLFICVGVECVAHWHNLRTCLRSLISLWRVSMKA